MELDGQVAIVTGAGRGIGRAIALGLADAGAQVVVADIAEEAARSVASEAERRGRRALALAVDVSQAPTVAQMVKQTLAEFGRIDILVNNAGVYRRATVEELDEEQWDRTLAVNLKGVFLCSKSVLPAMRRQRSGRIINLASGLGVTGAAAGAPYAASKAGVAAFTKSLAKEVASSGILVNAVAPGLTDTALARGAHSEEEMAQLAGRQPLARLGQPEDVVGLILFLAGPSSATITGQTFYMRLT